VSYFAGLQFRAVNLKYIRWKKQKKSFANLVSKKLALS
jgi:hypothetical protein